MFHTCFYNGFCTRASLFVNEVGCNNAFDIRGSEAALRVGSAFCSLPSALLRGEQAFVVTMATPACSSIDVPVPAKAEDESEHEMSGVSSDESDSGSSAGSVFT